MRKLSIAARLALSVAFLAPSLFAQTASVSATVFSEPLNNGRIDPMIFGNFIELLDDVVPGMWAELLGDRSFEGIVPPANWCYYDGSPDICDRTWTTNDTWTFETEMPFNGKRSAKLTAGDAPALLSQGNISLQKGAAYSFSGYLRADGDVKAIVSIKFLLPNGDWLTLASAELPAPNDQWAKYSAKLPSTGKTDRAVFELRAEGHGHLWADKLSLMPEDTVHGWRPDVVQSIKEIKPALIRWGGSSIDPGHYLWKDGIGDRDLRAPWLNKNWGRIDPNDVGIDEFCQFCESVGAEPLLCVSFGDGAASAGEMVEYCNGDSSTTWGAKRAANGHPEPYRVKYWQIGNEINGNNANYLEHIGEFIASIKQAEPNAQVMTSFPTQRLFDKVGKDVAFVCPHHYTTDMADCDRDFNEISRMIDQTPGCSNVKIGVTEWNVDAGAWGLGRATMETLNGGLLNARYLHVLFRHSDKVKIACRSNLANSYLGAVIETGMSGTGVLNRPSYYVMKLYATQAQPIPLRLERSSDRLDLFACGSDDKKNVVIFALNPVAEAANLELSFQGLGDGLQPASALTLCDTLNAGQPDIMNHWDVPDRIRIVSLPVNGKNIALPSLSVTAIICASH